MDAWNCIIFGIRIEYICGYKMSPQMLESVELVERSDIRKSKQRFVGTILDVTVTPEIEVASHLTLKTVAYEAILGHFLLYVSNHYLVER